jgi:hypothetical protein
MGWSSEEPSYSTAAADRTSGGGQGGRGACLHGALGLDLVGPRPEIARGKRRGRHRSRSDSGRRGSCAAQGEEQMLTGCICIGTSLHVMPASQSASVWQMTTQLVAGIMSVDSRHSAMPEPW